MKRTQRTLVGLTGIAATVLLHSLLFAVAIWDGGRLLEHPRLPDAVGSGANTGNPDGDPGERRLTVMLNLEFDEAPAPEPAPQLPERPMQQPSILEITGADILPMPPIEIEAPGEDAAAQDAELMARAKFAGIYESQIRARILRAWNLPQEPAPDPDFSCLVQIHQRSDGRVTAVEQDLAKCEGSAAWRQSVFAAILTASPLPAPPHPSVFVETFSLVLHSSAVETRGKTVQR